MWSFVLLPFLVGLVATSNHAWKRNTKYEYRVSGRTLTGFTDVSAEYTGVLLKAKFVVQQKRDGSLIGQVLDGQYAQVFTNLPDGWRSHVPSSDANYKPIPWSGKPFEIKMRYGVITDLLVDSDIEQWEGNMLKGIVSQIQVDAWGRYSVNSSINQQPEEVMRSRVFTTMEETVTGRYETLYEINKLPDYAAQMEPYLVPYAKIQDDNFLEIIKTKNFSRAERKAGYYYGLGEMPDVDPLSNQVGDLMSRSSVSRVVLSGSMYRYTIQYSVTTNKISVAPALMNSGQKGMVVSQMNLSLAHMEESNNEPVGPSNPKSLGGLTYVYEGRPIPTHDSGDGDKYASYSYNKPDEQSSASSAGSHENKQHSSEESSAGYHMGGNYTYDQSLKPSLDEPPFSPILPYYKNFEGRAIKAARIATEIGQELQDSQEIQKKHSLAKYVILTSIIRTLNDKEIEQVSEGLYTTEDRSANGDAWKAFRDAVVGSGTGPALITIQRWILTGKLRGDAASEAVSGLTQSVREPTEEFIKSLYHFLTKEEIKTKAGLNVTGILSLSELISQVYVNKRYSDNAYPAEIFGSFATKNGLIFVVFEYIPYLAEQLKHAVEAGDSHKIQVYISALGLVGHPEIAYVFKPYLEGTRKVSQFQRLHMVYSLERLVTNFPVFSRKILYIIYQNPREDQNVRIAAVYQLIRTGPSPAMLQRLAEYTNIDTNEHVSAAVKSIIQHIAHFNGTEYAYTVESARAAERHLINRKYGPQYSHSHKEVYGKQEQSILQYIGSPDSYLPKALRLSYRYNYAGYKKQYFNFQYAASSNDEIIRILLEQVKEYLDNRKKQEDNGLEGMNKWASEGVVKTLNITVEEREQAEANLIFKLGGFKRFFTLDNHTIESLPEVVREAQEKLRNGKPFRYTRFVNRYELEISYPTEMALPFVYSFDIPTVLSLDGSTKLSSQPEVSNGTVLRIPDKVQAEGDLHFLLSMKVQGRHGFFSPYDHEQYIAAYEKNSQLFLPVKYNMDVDVKDRQMQMQAGFQNPDRKTKLAYYRSTPYISHFDILKLTPAISNPSTKVIGPTPQSYVNTVYGKKSTGMAFRFEYAGDEKYLDFRWLYDQLHHTKSYSNLLSVWDVQGIGSRMMSLEYAGDESDKRHINAHFSYKSQKYDAPPTQDTDLKDLYNAPADPKQRLEEFAKKAAAGIPGANSYIMNANVHFEGSGKPNEYYATAGYASSNVESLSRALLYLGSGPEPGSYTFAAMSKNRFPKLSEMEPEKILEGDIASSIEAAAAFGRSYPDSTTVYGDIKMRRSNDRVEYLKKSHAYHHCQKDMQQGNKQLYACQEVVQQARYLDKISMKWKYQNMEPHAYNFTLNAYSWYRYFNFYHSNENYANGGHGKKDQVDMEIGFSPDYSAVNTSFAGAEYEARYENIRLNFMSSDEDIPVSYWLASPMSQIDYYRPTCVIDKSGVNSFDNRTYPAKLSNQWVLMMVHVPRHAKQHVEKDLSTYMDAQNNYAIFVKDDDAGQKHVKLYLRTPETHYRKSEISLKPASNGQYPVVLVDSQPQSYSDKQIASTFNKYLQVYGLPNGEARLDVAGEYTVIYDGNRVKVRLNNDRYYNAIRGVCGNANTVAADDLRAPENCAVRTPEELIQGYTVPDDASPQNPKVNNYKNGCYSYRYVYSYLISKNGEQGGFNQMYGGERGQRGCTKQQTRYVVDGENVCFTTRPLPQCQGSCKATSTLSKSVPVHCVKQSNVTQMFMNQIDKGASPDFGLKQPSKNMSFDVPQMCNQG